MKDLNSEHSFEYFNKAPIILAILQFRYERIEEFPNEAIKKKGVSIKNDFPEVQERFTQKINFKGNAPDGSTNVSLDERSIDGIQFISKDKKKNLVIGRDRFTYELHGQYSGWKVFSEDAKNKWELFQDELQGIKLSGISLRYVNRIFLPKELKDISEYFTTFIQSSSGEHIINGFQVKYTSSEPESNFTFHIGHVLNMPIDEKFPYLFDIDVICTKEIENNPAIIWEKFEKLRIKKNLIFNQGLTEKTKTLIR